MNVRSQWTWVFNESQISHINERIWSSDLNVYECEMSMNVSPQRVTDITHQWAYMDVRYECIQTWDVNESHMSHINECTWISDMNAYACENFLSECGFLLVSEHDFFFLVIRIESLLHVGCYNIFYIFTTQECEHSESLLHVGCYNIELLLHVGCYNILYTFTTQECEHSECLLHVGCHNIVYTFSHQNLSTFLCCVYMPQRLVQHIPAAQQCTGWPRCIGCLKLQDTSREKAHNYRAHLRNMT